MDYSLIASRVIRGALKQEFKKGAAKRGEDSGIKFTYWENGKPCKSSLGFFKFEVMSYYFILELRSYDTKIKLFYT